MDGWNAGLLTKNEARDLMDLPDVEGGDVFKISIKDNTLYLKTDFILSNSLADMKKPYSERIKGSRFEAEFKQLLDRFKNISEYMDA